MATAFTACSGGGAGGAAPPRSRLFGPTDSGRQIECNTGHPTPPEDVRLCRGTFATIDSLEGTGGAIVSATSSNARVATVAADATRDRTTPYVNGVKASWFDVTGLSAGTATVTLKDSRGDEQLFAITVTDCPTPTPAPTATPVPTATPTAKPTATRLRRRPGPDRDADRSSHRDAGPDADPGRDADAAKPRAQELPRALPL